MRNVIALALASVGLAMTALPSGAAESLGTILFGQPTQPGIIAFVIGRGKHDDDAKIPSIYRYPSPEMVARAQNEIASDAVIRDYLNERNIQPHNVLAIQTAANGGKVIYAR
ncbi:hypothetical protein [Pararhizobium gei]|uniref:hypothetical protein n=1 Tax=Pararhizobium gei TaxID=1395951 RepID=UPI0023D99A03|nr:hypothetical protein [Rhizobium gei]